jgi:hypothetical protein
MSWHINLILVKIKAVKYTKRYPDCQVINQIPKRKMYSILIYLGIGVLITILLGPYQIILSYDNRNPGHHWEVTVYAWSRLYGIRWITNKHYRSMKILLFNRTLFHKRSKLFLQETKQDSFTDTGTGKKLREKKISASCFIQSGIGRFPVWIRAILKNIHIKKMEGECEFGCINPAVTGILFGWLCILKSYNDPRIHIDINPDFSRSFFRGGITIVLKTILILFVFRALSIGIQGYRLYRICRA